MRKTQDIGEEVRAISDETSPFINLTDSIAFEYGQRDEELHNHLRKISEHLTNVQDRMIALADELEE